MTDEKYVFVTEVADKKRTARGVHNRRTHTGKGGCKLPSENMTRKEIDAMNGEVKTYNIKNPMKWHEFKAMPDDLKRAYLTRLRDLYNASNIKIGDMMGVSDSCIRFEAKRLGVQPLPKSTRTLPEWDSFVKYGSPERQTEDQVEETVCETVEVETVCDMEQPEKITFDQTSEGVWVGDGGLDYCHLYEEAVRDIEKMRCENKYLHEGIRELREENRLLEAKMSVVYLIFGGK